MISNVSRPLDVNSEVLWTSIAEMAARTLSFDRLLIAVRESPSSPPGSGPSPVSTESRRGSLDLDYPEDRALQEASQRRPTLLEDRETRVVGGRLREALRCGFRLIP